MYTYPSQAKLKELFDYDAEQGCLVDRRTMKPRIGSTKTGGYITTTIAGYSKCEFAMNRLIFIWHFGDAPENSQIDHIDRCKTNNRISNLRCTTRKLNGHNRSFKAVRYRPTNDRWQARIQVEGKCINLGHFDTEAEAVKARRQAEVKYFGEYAPSHQ